MGRGSRWLGLRCADSIAGHQKYQAEPNLEQDRIEGLARFLFKVGLAKSDVSSKLFQNISPMNS